MDGFRPGKGNPHHPLLEQEFRTAWNSQTGSFSRSLNAPATQDLRALPRTLEVSTQRMGISETRGWPNKPLHRMPVPLRRLAIRESGRGHHR